MICFQKEALRASPPEGSAASSLRRPPRYLLDAATRQLFREGTPLHLEPKVMDLLLDLAYHPGRCVSKEELTAQIWPGVVVSSGSAFTVGQRATQEPL